MDEANDLLQNGILVQTPKGLVCMSLNDALSSDLNLSVEDLQRVASQLLYQQSKKTQPLEKPLISVQSVQAINSSFISSDGLGDSDGFTSESSEINSKKCAEIKNKSTPIKLEHTLVEFSTDVESFLSSNVSDSDTSSVIINTINIDEKAVGNNDPLLECSKPPVKKRGGWPKGRKRKPELLHMPPKAPSTGYILYLNEQRKLFQQGNSLPFHEITKLIGNRWSSLSLGEKQPYLDSAEEEKKRYKEELKDYRQSGSYRMYLANKRRKRAKYNVMSESDMDATDEVDEEDNEELYCRTCDQYFHNLHNKREHLNGRQHIMQSVAGAIRSELVYETDTGSNSLGSTSHNTTITSTEAVSSNESTENDIISKQMKDLLTSISGRESKIKSLTLALNEKKCNNVALTQQLSQLKDRENKLKHHLSVLRDKEKEMDQTVTELWAVHNFFIINNNVDTKAN